METVNAVALRGEWDYGFLRGPCGWTVVREERGNRTQVGGEVIYVGVQQNIIKIGFYFK